jgi:pimeloyl-ACP methyl ester carboxylesterase
VRVAVGAVAAIALAYVAVCVFVFAIQRSLIYFPQPSSLGDRDTTVTLPASGARVVASVRERPGAKAVVYFGGNAEDVTLSIPGLAAAFPSHALYLLHYRGYGASGGTPSEAALVGDALALFDLAQREHASVEVVGRSLGSGIAVQVASARPAARLVLVTPYDSLVAIASAQFAYLPVGWLLRDRFESDRHAARVSAPTLLIAADRDEVISRASTERLLARFKPGVATLRVVAGDHNSVSEQPEYGPILGGSAASERR